MRAGVPVRSVQVRRIVHLLASAAQRTLMAMEARALIDKLSGERARFVQMARSRLGTDADAEDVVQRSMLRAAERAASLADPARARAWFYRILRREIIDHYRTRPREVSDPAAAENVAAEDDRPRGAPCRCALRLLDELRPAYAEVVRRVDSDGEEPAAVAAALGVSLANLYVRLHRARGALRERVKGHCGVTSLEPCLECTCGGRGRCC